VADLTGVPANALYKALTAVAWGANGLVYITTPIYYVNAAPHLGHAYTTIAADVMRVITASAATTSSSSRDRRAR